MTPQRSTKPVQRSRVRERDVALSHLGVGEQRCYKAGSSAGGWGAVGKGDGKDRRFIQVAPTG